MIKNQERCIPPSTTSTSTRTQRFRVAIWQVAQAMLLPSFFDAALLIVVGGVIAYPVAAWLAVPRRSRKVLLLGVASAVALYVSTVLLTS
jgi:ABC-type spermidine/putrescine transport system permease subunit I